MLVCLVYFAVKSRGSHHWPANHGPSWNMSPWPTSKALSGRSPRHRKHQFQFHFPVDPQHPWDPHGIFPWDFPSVDWPKNVKRGLSDAADVEKRSKQFLSTACSCYPVDVSSVNMPLNLNGNLKQWFWFSKPRNQSTGLMLSPDGQSPVFHITKIVGLCCV